MCVFGLQMNHLILKAILSSHNICFGWEVTKYIFIMHSYLEAGYVCLSVCFVTLRPMSTAMIMRDGQFT